MGKQWLRVRLNGLVSGWGDCKDPGGASVTEGAPVLQELVRVADVKWHDFLTRKRFRDRRRRRSLHTTFFPSTCSSTPLLLLHTPPRQQYCKRITSELEIVLGHFFDRRPPKNFLTA